MSLPADPARRHTARHVLRRIDGETIDPLAQVERERFALKTLRGDFDAVPTSGTDAGHRIRAVLRAVDA